MRTIKKYVAVLLVIVIASCSKGNKVDSMLESYDEYVTEYVTYMRKASKGNMSALSEYPKLLEQAQDLSSKIEECKGEMTTDQWNRFNEITAKMLDVIKDEDE